MTTVSRTVFIALTSAAVIAGVPGCGTSSAPTPITSASAATARPSPAAGAQSACADLGEGVDTDRSCHVHTDTPSYTLDFRFPVDHPDLQSVTDFLTQQRDDEINYAQEDPPRERPMPYSLNVKGTTYRSGAPDAGTQTLVLDIADDTAMANEAGPMTWHEAYNDDLGKGTPTTPDVVQTRHLNFAITDDAVIFFLDHDFLHEEGPPKVAVPRTEIASLLAWAAENPLSKPRTGAPGDRGICSCQRQRATLRGTV